MIDFTPLIRAFLEAAVCGTAIYFLMVGRKGPSARAWGSACVASVALVGMFVWRPHAGSSYEIEPSSPLSVAGPMAGALCSVAVGMTNRSGRWPHWLGIGASIAGFYFASLFLRLALSFVL